MLFSWEPIKKSEYISQPMSVHFNFGIVVSKLLRIPRILGLGLAIVIPNLRPITACAPFSNALIHDAT